MKRVCEKHKDCIVIFNDSTKEQFLTCPICDELDSNQEMISDLLEQLSEYENL